MNLKLTRATEENPQPPRYRRYLCLRPLEIAARLDGGAVVEALPLPSGAVLLRVGEFTTVIDAATLLASFEEV